MVSLAMSPTPLAQTSDGDFYGFASLLCFYTCAPAIESKPSCHFKTWLPIV